MKHITFTFVKNAFANVVRGGASAVVALALPHFFSHTLDTDRFAAWSLMLQIAAYASYLDFGLQTALARFLAQAVELGQADRRDSIISTALVMLSGAGAVAVLVIGLVLWQMPQVFHGIPAKILPEFRAAGAVLAIASCLSLPLSTATGVLIGLHRNEYPAVAIGLSRLSGAVFAIICAHYTRSLIFLSGCVAIPNVASGFYQVAAVKRLLPQARISLSFVRRALASELVKYCSGLTVWSISMFLVTGLDVTIVGHFHFSAVGYYSIAAVLINLITGLNGAIFGALMTPMAALHARGQLAVVRRMVLLSTRLNTYGNVLLYILTYIAGYQLLSHWVGPIYAAEAQPILIILAAAQTVRLTGYTFSLMLVATGHQTKGIAQGLAEALPNLFFSISLAHYFGPIGVAWGTLIGAFCGIAWILAFTMRWTYPSVPIDRSEFLWSGIVAPSLLASPFAMSLLLLRFVPSATNRVAVICACLLASLYLAYSAGYFSAKWPSTVQT